MIILNESNSKNNIIFLDDINLKDKVVIYFILLSFFLSQFYFWSSGVPQFSHLFIIAAIFLWLCCTNRRKVELF